MSWFSKMTTSTVIITCCSALVTYYLSKGFIIVEKVYGVFVNIPDPVIKKTNSSPLNDREIILACKSAIISIVKIFDKILITKYLYNKFQSSWYDETLVEPIIKKIQFFVKNVLTNLNIQPSSLNVLKIWTQLLIWKSH